MEEYHTQAPEILRRIQDVRTHVHFDPKLVHNAELVADSSTADAAASLLGFAGLQPGILKGLRSAEALLADSQPGSMHFDSSWEAAQRREVELAAAEPATAQILETEHSLISLTNSRMSVTVESTSEVVGRASVHRSLDRTGLPA